MVSARSRIISIALNAFAKDFSGRNRTIFGESTLFCNLDIVRSPNPLRKNMYI